MAPTRQDSRVLPRPREEAVTLEITNSTTVRCGFERLQIQGDRLWAVDINRRETVLKKIAGIALVLMGTTSMAAAQAQPLFDWSGFYAGASIGSVMGDVEMTHREGANGELNYGAAGATYDQDGSEAGYGLSLGYMYQMPSNLVLGAEISYSTGVDVDDGGAFVQFSDNRTDGSISDIYGLNLRAGYAVGPVVPYVTVGYARATLETRNSFDQGGTRRTFTGEQDSDGFRYGIGMLYGLSERTFVGIEYSRIDFETVQFSGLDSFGDSAAFSGDYSADMVTVTFGIRF